MLEFSKKPQSGAIKAEFPLLRRIYNAAMFW